MIDVAAIKLRYETLRPVLDARSWAVCGLRSAGGGRGGIAAVSAATGIARSTIGRGQTSDRSKTASAVQVPVASP